MLWCKVLRSPIAHGRIQCMDTGKVLAVPGVRVLVTGADLAGARMGKKIIDMPLLADGGVRYIGEKVAAVAADSEDAAATAASLIEVEYEELEVVVDPVEAARPSAPLVHPDVTTCPVAAAPDGRTQQRLRPARRAQGGRRRGVPGGRPGGGEHLHDAVDPPRLHRAPLLHRGGQRSGGRRVGLLQEPLQPAGPHGGGAGHSGPQDRRPSRFHRRGFRRAAPAAA